MKNLRISCMGLYGIVFLTLAVLATAGCLNKEASTAGEDEIIRDVTLETVVAKLLEHELLVEPKGVPEILQIDEVYLDIMKVKYPAIYEGVEAGIYEVRFGNLLVVYDHEKDEVKKQYVLRSIDVGR